MKMLSTSPLLATLALALALPTVAARAAEGNQDRPKQLVLISFDGAGPNARWVESRGIARANKAHFTYFLSCTWVIDRATGKTYRGPGQKAGRSNIGFAPDKADVADRLGHIWNAVQEGHEIGSHTCGHFDGGKWGATEWASELTAFRTTLADAWKTADVGDREPQGWRDFVRDGIKGFRAPYLSTSPSLLPALKADGYAFDASGVTKGPQMPEEKDGMTIFGLPLVPEGPKARPVIAMDYNLYARHSGAKENIADAAIFEARTLGAFRAAFEKEYAGERVPLQLGFHFTEMNGWAYWRAMKRFVTEVCGKEDVACVTYSEAIRLLGERRPQAGKQATL